MEPPGEGRGPAGLRLEMAWQGDPASPGPAAGRGPDAPAPGGDRKGSVA
jgi:hypothetical protein